MHLPRRPLPAQDLDQTRVRRPTELLLSLVAFSLLAYLGGSALASASPTPGGLGAVEASLTVGLSVLQVPIDQAIAGMLVFRLITFWLPIIPGILAFRYIIRHTLR